MDSKYGFFVGLAYSPHLVSFSYAGLPSKQYLPLACERQWVFDDDVRHMKLRNFTGKVVGEGCNRSKS